MFQRILAFGLVALLSLGFLAACGSSEDDEPTPGASPAQSSNAPAIATATAQSEIADTWTPTPEPEHEEEGDSAGPTGPVELQIEAVDIAFDVNELEGPADTDFTITLTNNGAADHDFVIEGTDFRTNILAGGSSETITINLPAGEYTFFCSIPGHRPAGMEGTLIIAGGGGEETADETADDADAEDADSEDAEADDAGDSGAAPAPSGPVELQIAAVDIAFDVKELEGPADTDFTITLTNNGAADHDFEIEGTDFKTSLLAGGESETITVNLPAGEYTFFCSVPGHRPAGMEGTLIISEGGGASVAPAEESAPQDEGAEADDAGDSGAAPAPTGPVELQIASVDIAFDVKELEGPADTDFTITLTNNGAADHDFVIEGTDFKTSILPGGESETITVNLPAGEYTFFCSIPGHRPAGMEGTLIISEGGGASVAPAEDSTPEEGAASPEATSDEPVELDIEAVDIAYSITELEGPADTDFTITLTNNGNAQHDFVIEGTDFKTELVDGGSSQTITVNLPAGEYTFYCSVPGHRALMEGTLTITESDASASGSDDAGGDGAAAGGEAVALDIEAVDIAYSITELEGPADTDFTITLTNNGNAQHDFVIEGTDFKTQLVNGGSSETITVNLPPGEYTFYCSVPGHRALMEGTLTIK